MSDNNNTSGNERNIQQQGVDDSANSSPTQASGEESAGTPNANDGQGTDGSEIDNYIAPKQRPTPEEREREREREQEQQRRAQEQQNTDHNRPTGRAPNRLDGLLDDMEVVERRNGNSYPRPLIHNIEIIFDQHTAWSGMFRYNEFTNTIELSGRLPVKNTVSAWMPPRPLKKPMKLEDKHLGKVQSWLEWSAFSNTGIAVDKVKTAIVNFADDHAYNPVMDLFNKFCEDWDGTSRLASAMKTYFGVDGDEAYLAMVGRVLFCSVAARATHPGCKVDTTVILEGTQGIYKSTACQVLALSPKYFSDSLPSNVENKDAQTHLVGLLIIELGELASMRKSELGALKHFLTKREDRVRKPYSRLETIHPRTCVFIGTTNDYEYLRDVTGNRRFLPVRCNGKIDTGSLARDLPQLYGEAMYLVNQYYKNHVPEEEPVIGGVLPPWAPKGDEVKLAKEATAERLVRDPWEDDVLAYVNGEWVYPEGNFNDVAGGKTAGSAPRVSSWVDEVSIRELLAVPLDIPIARHDKLARDRVVNILAMNGWTKVRQETKGEYRKSSVYERPVGPVAASGGSQNEPSN